MTDRAIPHGLLYNRQTVRPSDQILMRLCLTRDHLEYTYLTCNKTPDYRSAEELLCSAEVNRRRERSFTLSFYFLRSTQSDLVCIRLIPGFVFSWKR